MKSEDSVCQMYWAAADYLASYSDGRMPQWHQERFREAIGNDILRMTKEGRSESAIWKAVRDTVDGAIDIFEDKKLWKHQDQPPENW